MDRPKQKRVWINQDVIDGPLCLWTLFVSYSNQTKIQWNSSFIRIYMRLQIFLNLLCQSDMVQISHLLCLVSYGGASVFNMKKNCVGLGCLLPVLGGQMPTDFVKIEQKSNMATANYQADHAGSRRHRCHTEVRYENVLPGWCSSRP